MSCSARCGDVVAFIGRSISVDVVGLQQGSLGRGDEHDRWRRPPPSIVASVTLRCRVAAYLSRWFTVRSKPSGATHFPVGQVGAGRVSLESRGALLEVRRSRAGIGRHAARMCGPGGRVPGPPARRCRPARATRSAMVHAHGHREHRARKPVILREHVPQPVRQAQHPLAHVHPRQHPRRPAGPRPRSCAGRRSSGRSPAPCTQAGKIS